MGYFVDRLAVRIANGGSFWSGSSLTRRRLLDRSLKGTLGVGVAAAIGLSTAEESEAAGRCRVCLRCAGRDDRSCLYGCRLLGPHCPRNIDINDCVDLGSYCG